MERLLKEFKEFISRGNLVELAVAFVLGVAFAALMDSFIDNIINPILGGALGQAAFASLTIDLWGDSRLTYGAFLTELITFAAVVATVFFFIVKPYNRWKKRRETGAGEELAAPPEEIALLREIRDAVSR